VSTNNDYANNRKYDLVPLTLTNAGNGSYNTLKQVAPFQSAQVKSLWLYSRERSVGLEDDLYALSITAPNDTVSQGVSPYAPSTNPVNGCFLFPTDPTLTGGNPDIWAGTASGVGGGTLSEFSIHKNHPDLTGTYTANLFEPNVNADLTFNYPKFMHSDFFWKDSTFPDGKKQLQHIIPNQIPAPTTLATDARHYPAKLGFYANDEYLVGKYTCGAYLYMAPLNYESIAVDGSTELAKKLLEFGEEKAVNIPLVFQFRASDKLSNVGGYRNTGNISNITYIKKIGIDIQARNESLFSFDIEISCKYEQDSLTRPIYVPNVALDRLNAIRNQASSSGTSAR